MFTLDFPELFRDEGLNGLGSLDHEAEGRELAAATTVQLHLQGCELVLEKVS